MNWILTLMGAKPRLALLLITALSGLAFGIFAGGLGYFKGREHGKLIESNLCLAGKTTAVKKNLEKVEKKNEIRNSRPDDGGLLGIVRDNAF